MGVTNIKKWINNTNEEVRITKLEDSGNWIELRPGETRKVYDMWIPWVNTEGEYKSKKIDIHFKRSDVHIYMFQGTTDVRTLLTNGADLVRASRPIKGQTTSSDGWGGVAGAEPVKNASWVNGDRTITFLKLPKAVPSVLDKNAMIDVGIDLRVYDAAHP